MAWTTLFRTGEQVSEQMFQRVLGQYYYVVPATGGVGTGFSKGAVGIMNGAHGTDPNHFAVDADGSDMVLTIHGGWAFIVKDTGSSSFDPLTYMVENSGSQTYTVPSNSQGSTRVDTICIRLDQSIAPDGTGSNLPTIFNVMGGASSALGNAPSDGALYYPLALVTVANLATSLANGNITDKRAIYPADADPASVVTYRARAYRGSDLTNYGAGAAIPFNTVDYDPSSNFNTSAGIFTAPVDGYYNCEYSVGYSTTGTGTGAFVLCDGASATRSRGGDTKTMAASTLYIFQRSDTIKLLAGNTVGVKLETAPSGTTTITSDPRYTSFAVNLISTT